MGRFLPTGTLPAALHMLASLQPRGAHGACAAPGAEVASQEDAWLGWHHFHATLSFVAMML